MHGVPGRVFAGLWTAAWQDRGRTRQRYADMLGQWTESGVADQRALSRLHIGQIIAAGVAAVMLLAGDRFPDIDPGVLQDPMDVALAVRFALLQPAETVIPEMTVLPMRETSWP